MKKMNEFLIRKTIPVILMTLGMISIYGQEMKDLDGHIYQSVQIGNLTWTTSNLDVSKFRNGDTIMEATTAAEWEQAGTSQAPAWCYYDNDTANGRKYGKLYNWYAVNDPRGLAPEGWRIPSNEDWRVISKTQGGVDVAGARIKNPTGWKITDLATNKSGFSGLPAGIRYTNSDFKEIHEKTYWWSTTKDTYSNMVYSLMVADPSPEIRYLKIEKGFGASVRCVKQ